MRYIILYILYIFLCTPVYAIESDKAVHFTVSSTATWAMGSMLQTRGVDKESAMWISAFTIFTAGIVKESMDKEADWGDVGANMFGISAGVLMLKWNF